MTLTVQDKHPSNYFDLQFYKTELKHMQYDLEFLKVETQKRSIVLEKIFFKRETKNSAIRTNCVQIAHISSFSDKIILKIFLQLDFRDAFNIVTTCKRWQTFSNDPTFVRYLIDIKRPDMLTHGRGLNLNAWVSYGKAPLMVDRLKKMFFEQETKNSVIRINCSQIAHISSFPHEIILKIFLELDFRDAFNVIRTCKKWSAFSNDPTFVRYLIKIKRPDMFTLGAGLNLNAWAFYGKVPFILDKLNHDICKIREGYQKDIEKRQETMALMAISILAPCIGNNITFPMTRRLIGFIKSLI